MTNDLMLQVSFPDQSASFVLGCEAGMIWSEMQAGVATIVRGMGEGFPVHTANLEVLRRMAASAGYVMETDSTDVEGWSGVHFERSSRPRPSLSIITGGAAR